MFKSKYYTLGALILVLAGSLIFALGIKNSLVKIVSAQSVNKDIKKETPANDARLQLANRLKEKGDDLAIRSAKKYLVSNPNDTDILTLLADAYIKNNNLSAAEETVKRTIAVKPNDHFALIVMAKIYVFKAKLDFVNAPLALKQIEQALIYSPLDIWLLTSQAEIYAAQNNLEKANQALDKAISLSSSSKKSALIMLKERINKPVLGKSKIKK